MSAETSVAPAPTLDGSSLEHFSCCEHWSAPDGVPVPALCGVTIPNDHRIAEHVECVVCDDIGHLDPLVCPFSGRYCWDVMPHG